MVVAAVVADRIAQMPLLLVLVVELVEAVAAERAVEGRSTRRSARALLSLVGRRLLRPRLEPALLCGRGRTR